MSMNRRWGLLLALAGGMAIGGALALGRRRGRRHIEKKQQKHDLHSWEGEGGNLAPRSAT